jgi:hypothetical protein
MGDLNTHQILLRAQLLMSNQDLGRGKPPNQNFAKPQPDNKYIKLSTEQLAQIQLQQQKLFD